MSKIAIHPSTMGGIKRLARSIKRDREITHTLSLDEAAQAAGYQNFRHAQNSMPVGDGNTRIKPPSHRLFITAYWRDREGLGKGRETQEIRLSVPWESLITKAELKYQRSLMHYRKDASDHLERLHDLPSQDSARDEICAVARAMQFMEATGLRPAKKPPRKFSRIHPKLPGLDHSSEWMDPISLRMLVIDEPYDMAVEGKKGERADWAARHGFRIEASNWAGMYYPGHCVMHLLSAVEEGVPLDPLMDILDKMPALFDSQTWSGTSAPYSPVFISPDRRAMPARKNERPDPRNALRPYRNSIGFVQSFVGAQRRPDASMPIEAHEQVAGLLKAVLAVSHSRKGVYNRVDRIRSELDEWVQREYDHNDLPNERFHKMYYGDHRWSDEKPTETDRKLLVSSLNQIGTILRDHYPSCTPLNVLIRSIGAAQKSLASWN